MKQSLAKSAYNPDTSTVSQLEGNASVLGGAESGGAALTARPGEWAETHKPNAATKATITRAAPGANKRLVITGFSGIIACAGNAQTTIIFLEVYFGATLKYCIPLNCPTNDHRGAIEVNLNIVAGANETVTVEFSAAGVADSRQVVNLRGYTAPA